MNEQVLHQVQGGAQNAGHTDDDTLDQIRTLLFGTRLDDLEAALADLASRLEDEITRLAAGQGDLARRIDALTERLERTDAALTDRIAGEAAALRGALAGQVEGQASALERLRQDLETASARRNASRDELAALFGELAGRVKETDALERPNS